jgi:uncharacterized protein (TIGR03790 family)
VTRIGKWEAVLVAGFFLGGHAFATDRSDAEATIVIHNNALPASLDLAGFYAEQRGIPLTHVIGLDCPLNEEITREEYDRTIAGPLRAVFAERDWWVVKERAGQREVTQNRIRYVVLMHGMPLKIAAIQNYEGDTQGGQPEIGTRNEAAVDSELATLGIFTRQISGVARNPYFRSYTPFADAPLAPMLIVCRLDGPTPAIVRKMIADTMAAEREGVRGFAMIDARGLKEGGLAEGDRWMMSAANQLRRSGMPVILDVNPEIYPEDYPARNVALYLGWYAADVAGPFARDDFRFARGAVACHIHSFSAVTLRDPKRGWAAPLVARGAVATAGNVYEPYLALTPNLDVLVDRLRNGFRFGEAAYASSRALSWMTTFIGDPLYRPFPIVEPAARDSSALQWGAFAHGSRQWFADSRKAGEATLWQSARELQSGVVAEGLGLLQLAANDSAAALASFQQAREFHRNAEDILRVTLHETACLLTLRRQREALSLIRRQRKAFPSAHGAALLGEIENKLAPRPAATSPAAR